MFKPFFLHLLTGIIINTRLCYTFITKLIILNKIRIMHLKNKPQGYASGFASHGDPAYSNPPIKLIQVKQEETLLGANLKSFIKERLFGNFINYTKLHNARKYNFTPPVSSLTELRDEESTADPMRSAPYIRQSFKTRINDIRNAVQKKVQERYLNGGQVLGEKGLKNRLSHRNSLGSNLQQSILLNSQRARVNKTTLAKNSLNGSRIDRNHSYDFEKYPAPSFISAIQDTLEQSSRLQHSGRKLSPINNKSQLINKLENAKKNLNSSNQQIKKSPNRLQIEKFEIIQSTWQLFYQPIKPKNEKSHILPNNSNIVKDFSNVNDSFISSIPRSMDNRMSDLLKSNQSIERSKFSIGKTHFMKQSFLQYLNNTNFNYAPLANHYSFFFEIGSKVCDQLKMEQYKILVEPIVTSSLRVWAVSSFRFWDINQDGIICSKDIFAMYQAFDKEQTRLKQNYTIENHRGFKILSRLKEILQDIRKVVLQINFDFQLQKKTNITLKVEDTYEIKYIQQALLRKKQTKYSDLLLILGQKIKNSSKESKKSVIDTAKELNMKFSSCYRYSFLATDHNEQTRQDRERIQNLKQQLRKEKLQIIEKEKQQQLEKDRVLGLSYQAYLEKQLFMKMKALVLELFAIKLH